MVDNKGRHASKEDISTKSSFEEKHRNDEKDISTDVSKISSLDNRNSKNIDNEIDHVEVNAISGEAPTHSVKENAKKAQGDFMHLLNEAVNENLKKHYPSADEELLERNTVENQLIKINNGKERHTKETLSELKGVSRRYPGKPTPSKPIQEDLEKHLKWIMEHLNEDDFK